MSAYTRPPGQIISISPSASGAPDIANSNSDPHNGADKLRQASSEIDAFMAVSHQMEATLAQGRANCKRLKDELAGMQARHEEVLRTAEKKFRDFHAREQDLLGTIAAQKENELKLSAQIHRLQGHANDLGSEVTRAKLSYEEMRTAAKQKIEALSRRENEYTTEIARGKASTEELRAAARLKIDQLSQRETSLQAMVQAQQLQETHLKDKLRNLQESLERAQNEITLYKNSWAEVLTMDRDARIHLNQKEANDAERAAAKARIEKLEALNQELVAEAKERIGKLELSSRELQSSHHAALADLANAENRVTQVQAAAQKRIAELQLELEKQRREVQQIRANGDASILKLNQDLTEAKGAAKTFEGQVGDLQTQLATLLISSQELRSQMDDTDEMETRIGALAEEFEKANTARRELQEERNALKKQLADSIQEMQEAQKKSELLRRNYPLRDLLAHKSSELVRATRELQNIKADHPSRQKAEDIVDTLMEQRDQLRQILSEAERR